MRVNRYGMDFALLFTFGPTYLTHSTRDVKTTLKIGLHPTWNARRLMRRPGDPSRGARNKPLIVFDSYDEAGIPGIDGQPGTPIPDIVGWSKLPAANDIIRPGPLAQTPKLHSFLLPPHFSGHRVFLTFPPPFSLTLTLPLFAFSLPSTTTRHNGLPMVSCIPSGAWAWAWAMIHCREGGTRLTTDVQVPS